MRRVAVIVGSHQAGGTDGQTTVLPTLPASDRAAIGMAIKRFGGPVDAYCLRDDANALRYALAAGAATAGRLDDVAAIDFDVALVGSGGAGSWGDLLPALLAEQQQCAMVFDVLDITPGCDGLTVTRDLGRGSKEVLAIAGPVVLSIAENAVQLLYVSRYRRQAVLPLQRALRGRPAADPVSAVSGPWQPARPRVKTGDLAAKTGGSASGRMQALLGVATGADQEDDRVPVIVADAATCAQQLLRFLSHHGILARSVPAPAARTPTEEGTASRPSASSPQDGQGPEASIKAPHRRGPRPLQPSIEPSQQSGRGTRARSPRPVGQTVPQRIRSPRPVDPGSVP